MCNNCLYFVFTGGCHPIGFCRSSLPQLWSHTWAASWFLFCTGVRLKLEWTELATGWRPVCSSCHNVQGELSTFSSSTQYPLTHWEPRVHFQIIWPSRHRWYYHSMINIVAVSTKGTNLHSCIYIKGNVICLTIISSSFFVQFKWCYRPSKLHFQIYWRRVVDSTFAFHNPSYSKDPRFRPLWETTTFTPTRTETLVCTRVTLSKLNMDMVFRVGGRSRQHNRMLKTSGSFIINE